MYFVVWVFPSKKQAITLIALLKRRLLMVSEGETQVNGRGRQAHTLFVILMVVASQWWRVDDDDDDDGGGDGHFYHILNAIF